MSVLLLLFFRKVLPPACHLERSPPEIPPSLCSVLLRSSTPLRFAQNDTGGHSRNPKGERQRRSDLAGRLKPALWKTPLRGPFGFGFIVQKCNLMKKSSVNSKQYVFEKLFRLFFSKRLLEYVGRWTALRQKSVNVTERELPLFCFV